MLLKGFLTRLEPQSRFGDKLLENWVLCPQNGTAVLNGSRRGVVVFWWMRWKVVGCGTLKMRHIGFDSSYDCRAFVLASSSLSVP